MKSIRYYLLFFLAGLLLIRSGGETPGTIQQEGNPSTEGKGLLKDKGSGEPVPPENAGEVNPEMLRDLAFRESNPDFSFPARKARYFYNGASRGNKICLTFDDGPHPQYTPQILSILKEKKAKATFFLTGENVRYYPHIVKAIVESGCEVGNHSYSHAQLKNLALEKIREELEKNQAEIKKACGISPLVIRFPYGVSSSEIARTAYEMRMDPFFWSIDTNDYKNETTTEDIVKTVLKDVKGGSIILMHDKTQKVVESVNGLIDPIREKGYEFVTCSELAAEVRLDNRQMEKKDAREMKTEQSKKGGEK
jgi:peptidoglycan/xylan/chitin deacetylase (PgdA/CDA1 family)